MADRVNGIGRMDAVIHNAGIYNERSRSATPEGHARILAVNTLAPYLLTALIERPARLIYLSSGMHRGGGNSLRDIDWLEAAAGTRAAPTQKASFTSQRWPSRSPGAARMF